MKPASKYRDGDLTHLVQQIPAPYQYDPPPRLPSHRAIERRRHGGRKVERGKTFSKPPPKHQSRRLVGTAPMPATGLRLGGTYHESRRLFLSFADLIFSHFSLEYMYPWLLAKASGWGWANIETFKMGRGEPQGAGILQSARTNTRRPSACTTEDKNSPVLDQTRASPSPDARGPAAVPLRCTAARSSIFRTDKNSSETHVVSQPESTGVENGPRDFLGHETYPKMPP
ncbi:hypothetical protein N7532_011805 [Penicillium argentinense]|uniref:Uncharacterized protein n=1 Tax=Penicillium argentinense TaxID=1131581 RepID=A0A9W9EJ62_9EURO|nr:uncharacterized protein N7532_011805 [Penicillium argentinense]KAJ5082762.1 hypothetical protein N7532_011805 [Penicillium argentinense]